jgi:hypothetical protein
MKEKQLPPDASQLRLAALVNGRLNGVNGQVNFFNIDRADGSIETGIVFSCGVRRAVVKTRAMLGDADADELVRNVTEWINDMRPQSKWTTDPQEAA